MRFRVTRIIYIIIISLIVARLGYWQVIKADNLSAKADDQRLLTQEVEGNRGKIVFSDGSTLASTQPMFLVYVQPQLIKGDKKLPDSYIKTYQEDFATKVSEVFYEEDQKLKLPDIEESSTSAMLRDLAKQGSESAQLLLEELSESQDKTVEEELEGIKAGILKKLNSNLYWVSLGKKVNVVAKKKLESFNFKGLGFETSTSRFYPEGSSSAHLLGFVASDAYGGQTGYFGVEGFYNGELKGKKGVIVQERDALGLPILIGKFSGKDPKDGKVLSLSVDRTVQHVVEEKLREGFEKFRAKSASAIVMDPLTGNILAMASIPSYDPGNVLAYPKENFKNPITADGYEPGSTFKVLVMGAALNEGVVQPETVCDNCNGPVEISGYQIRTWNNKYQDRLTMTDTIIHSDNTGMVFASKKMGLDKMYDYIGKYGFGNHTGVDVQDEYAPELREKQDWKEIDLATSSFGQGISVTALQMVKAVSSIANKGVMMEPHIVSKIVEGKDEFLIKPKVLGQVIKPEAASQVTEMMIQAVDQGEAQFYKKRYAQGFSIAGKTGTAQIPVAGHYDANKTIASFVGFAPANNPKFVMLVRYDQPQTSIYGADTAAPTFFQIAKELFMYYGIAPTGE